MKDEILKSFFASFVDEFELNEIDKDKAFERFVNYNIISTLYPREIDFEDLSTGGSNDLALDGIAIVVNGNIIKNEEEIDFLLEKNGTLSISFALVQSKSSVKFKGEQVGNFIFGVKSFFDDKPSIPENDKIKRFREIKEKIYRHSINFEQNPELKLFFVTTGTWKEPEQIVGKVRRELKELDERSLFRNETEVEFYDAERLKSTYREISRKTVKEIPFNNHVALPDMPMNLNIRQSFVGSIPVKAYLELIKNNDGKLSKGLFYDNVRDYQGFNKVNKEINETLKSSMSQSLLPLLNNGITIIAKKIEKIGSKLKLTDFQIVNGCQSSHVLFNNRSIISEDTHIVLKVIDTTDQDVTNKIIRATNRQTEVKDEAFESIKPFHKDLQEFYKAKASNLEQPIFYERRSKEFIGNTKVKSWQVITLASQVKTYVSTALGQPQSTHRYFGELLESNRDNLFSAKSDFNDYYLSSLIINRLESLLKTNSIYKKYRPFKYHITYLTYIKFIKKKSKDYGYKEMIADASDKWKLRPMFIAASKTIANVLKKHPISNKSAIRSRDFTKKIKREAI